MKLRFQIKRHATGETHWRSGKPIYRFVLVDTREDSEIAWENSTSPVAPGTLRHLQGIYNTSDFFDGGVI